MEGRVVDFESYSSDSSNDILDHHQAGEADDATYFVVDRNSNDDSKIVPSYRHAILDTAEVLKRIEAVAHSVLVDLEEEGKLPHVEEFEQNFAFTSQNHYSSQQEDFVGEVDVRQRCSSNRKLTKEFNLQQSRSMTSIVMVLSYCHNLLLQGKTTTIRELYYFYVTHFRNQKECDLAIRDAAVLLNVPRHALGLKASPKGWYCGDLQITTTTTNGEAIVTDARALTSFHGAPIDSTWVHLCNQDNNGRGGDDNGSDSDDNNNNNQRTRVSTMAARCILVVEKEGIYNRLAEDRFYDAYPCIIMTAKGFPDLASRAMLHYLYQHLKLPVWGLCDCNPFGVLVMHTYFRGSNGRGNLDGGTRFAVPIQWMGLRPSQVEALKQETEQSSFGETSLPPQVFQELTVLDRKRLEDSLLGSFGFEWTCCSERRVEELELMRDNGYKMELEALHWLGMDFFYEWLGRMFEHEQAKNQYDLNETEERDPFPEDSRDII
ncbi:hypothetical protein ACA910_000819 [Epithemia clementina (nom. ined.)]